MDFQLQDFPGDARHHLLLALPILCALANTVAIVAERSGTILSRRSYAVQLCLFGLLPYLLLVIANFAYEDAQIRHEPVLPVLALAAMVPGLLFIAGFAGRIVIGALCARLLVRRLRDAGITAKLAYLTLIPYLNALVFLALAIYPPSRRQKPIPVEVF